MKDFDKIFSEKLYDHRTPPPSSLWDELENSLDAEAQKNRKALYWKVAAAVAFLLLGASFWWFKLENTDERIAQQVDSKTETIQPEHEPSVLDKDQAAPEQLALQPKIKTETNDAPSKARQESEKLQSVADKLQNSNASDQSKSVTPTQLALSEKVPEALEKVALDEDLNIVETEPQKLQSQTLATLEINVPENKLPVTIIYKPGNPAELTENDQEINKPLDLLADLKNSGISIAEIRNAKSDLLAKVFSKLDNEISR